MATHLVYMCKPLAQGFNFHSSLLSLINLSFSPFVLFWDSDKEGQAIQFILSPLSLALSAYSIRSLRDVSTSPFPSPLCQSNLNGSSWRQAGTHTSHSHTPSETRAAGFEALWNDLGCQDTVEISLSIFSCSSLDLFSFHLHTRS